MSENITKVRGTTQAFKNDKGGAVTRNYPLIGIVKNNIDPQKAGRIQVFIEDMGSSDSDDGNSWVTVSYMSPFFGATSPSAGDSSGHGSYVNNPHAYGFWATPPDVGTKVVCIFVNGDANFGYYIGCIPESGYNHMVPAIGSSTNITANDSEADSYGGAKRLPVSEVNKGNSKLAGSTETTSEARPIHSYQAAILNKQGLLRDADRGTIGSNAMRESPSRVIGLSSPGRPIYEGGYDDSSIKDAAKSASADKLKIAGRRGGHSIVLDDGDQSGADQLLRLRTASGHQIMMNDTAEALFIIHSNGQSWVELGKEGTVDIYSTNSFNVRTQGDLNLHADNNINIHATKNLTVKAENIYTESEKDSTLKVGAKFNQHTTGDHTVKVDGGMAFAAGASAGFAAGGTTYVNGSKVNLNTGSSPLTPGAVKTLPVVKHTDTLYDGKKGYAAAPGKLESIVSRAPAHMPWADLGLGVDVKVNLSADAAFPSAPSASVQAANNAVPSSPANPTNPSLASTVRSPQAASSTLNKNTTSLMVSQAAVNAATGPAAEQVKSGSGVKGQAQTSSGDGQNGAMSLSLGSVSNLFGSGSSTPEAVVGKFGLNATQLASVGTLKPGADAIVNKALAAGKSLAEAMPTNLFTGKDGINNYNDFTKNMDAQIGAQCSLLGNAEKELKAAGAITGSESPTQTAGLIMTAASLGTGPALDYAKSLTSGAGGLGLKMPEGLPSLSNLNLGAPSELMAAGKFAAGMADKVTSGLGSLSSEGGNALDSLKGAAAGAFAKVTGMFKTLKSKVPVNLNKVNAEAAEEAAAKAGASADEIKEAAKSAAADSSGLANLPGGLGAAKNMVSGLNPKSMIDSLPKSLDGVKAFASNAIASASSGATTAVTGGISSAVGAAGSLYTMAKATGDKLGSLTSGGATPSLDSVGSTLSSAKSGLMSLAQAGMGAGAMSKLNASIGSITSGGPLDIKLPTVAEATSSFDAIKDKSKALLGDPKIPALSFGSFKIKVPTKEEAEKYDKLKADLDKEEDNYFSTRKAFWDAKGKFGPDAPETKTAEASFKESAQKLETIRTDMRNVTT